MLRNPITDLQFSSWCVSSFKVRFCRDICISSVARGMIFEPKVVIKTIMRLFTRIVALKIITEYVNINNMYTEYIKEISPHIFLLLGKENCIVWSVASGFKGVQAPPLPPSPPPPPIGPSVWFFLNVSDAKIIATVARYYSISQFLIFLRPKRTKFIWVFFFFFFFFFFYNFF